jgi:hypothetical protein
MSDVTIYKPAGVTVNVVDGDPPVDQTAEVAALTADVTAKQQKIEAARVAAQGVLDALA